MTLTTAQGVQGQIFMVRISSTGWSRIPLECTDCGARRGLTLIPDPVGYVCPRGHHNESWSLTAEARVFLRGDDTEVHVHGSDGPLARQQFDEGDGWDDTRTMPW